MKRDIDTLLKHALSPTEEPDFRLNQKILKQVKEKENMTGKRKHKWVPATIAAVLTLTLGSVSAVAAWKYLTPDQVAGEIGGSTLAEAFDSADSISLNEKQSFSDYTITLMGIVSGKNLTTCVDEASGMNLEQDKTYTVVAIEHSDGTPMPDTSSDDYGKAPFFVSPLLKGYDPNWYNIMTMNGGYGEFAKDGIQYRIIECDNIEIFADNDVYLCVSSGTFYDQNAYHFDEATGTISRNEEYAGVNALFTLPLDKEKADSVAAKAFIDNVDRALNGGSMDESEAGTSTQEMEDMDGVDEVSAWMEKITPENIEKYATRIEETVMTVMPDANGSFHVSYELENGAGSDLITDVRTVFEGMTSGMDPDFGYSSDGTLEGLLIDTLTLNEDGSVTYAAYRPKL